MLVAPDVEMAQAAKARRLVELEDGRRGRLVYWPIPDAMLDPAKAGPERHRAHRRTLATVKIGTRHERIHPSAVTRLLPEG